MLDAQMLPAGKRKGHLHGGESGRCRYIQMVTLQSRHDDFMLFVHHYHLPIWLDALPVTFLFYFYD
jgi:hypothetical protein